MSESAEIPSIRSKTSGVSLGMLKGSRSGWKMKRRRSVFRRRNRRLYRRKFEDYVKNWLRCGEKSISLGFKRWSFSERR